MTAVLKQKLKNLLLAAECVCGGNFGVLTDSVRAELRDCRCEIGASYLIRCQLRAAQSRWPVIAQHFNAKESSLKIAAP